MNALFKVLLLSLALSATASALPDRFDAIASQADAARLQERVPDAIRLYREGTQQHPTWSDGWWYLGSLLYDQDRFSEAAPAFRHLLASTTHRGPAYAFLGLCDYENGKYDDALEQFHAWANAGWSGTPELRDVAVFHFALLLTREGRFVDALYLLATEAQRHGNTPELTEAMGLASLRLRKLPEDVAPALRERVWLAGKAAVYAAQSPRDFARADEFVERLEALYPNQPDVHNLLGEIYTFEGKNADAERAYREELKISPNHVSSLQALASIDLEKGDLVEAALMARRAVEADPGSAEAHHLLGRVFLENGDLQSSVKELETAKRLAPDSPLVRSHLALVYNKLGRTQESKAESAAFLTLKKKDEVNAPAKEKLAETTQEKSH